MPRKVGAWRTQNLGQHAQKRGVTQLDSDPQAAPGSEVTAGSDLTSSELSSGPSKKPRIEDLAPQLAAASDSLPPSISPL
ncbi:hypothetical protein GSI_09808 [Ganoderma sinense ZZ0214-1]|uniref:Uncharacterized protein n=1 Tax=Ganoderma sinense ZZ0214-1 TaxID=1077348 RepID=A0A2G8S2Q9_9APHY|nr:hypothetical protein GSI_09808 [Ganoderma sinense ZZ0214-1]